MKKLNNRLPELLAPAGSLEHLKAAILAGADAVYFGGARFGARAYAQNFTKEAVIEGLDFVHFHDKRAYMTVNTLLKEKELKEDLYDYLLPYYEAGLDGVIVQDLGAASFIRDHFPGMEVHGSTQMMITSASGAAIAKEMGMNRVVPARELSMEEIMNIKEETGLEIEVFIHGALCYCYSGQCLFSSMYGGRSGNRGRCAQPCRLPYQFYDAHDQKLCQSPKHLLSPKDLFSLNTLPSMIEAGVDSLKIEGRMKNVDYVAGVTSIYRKYLDLYASGKSYQVEKEDIDTLEELYSRSGFTDGYWRKHNGSDMMSIETPRHMGRKIGKIVSMKKNQLTIQLNDSVLPKDLLVISKDNEEEIVLTVPAKLDSILKKKGKSYEIILNAPKSRWLKPGLVVYRRHNEKIEKQIRENVLNRVPRYPVTAYMSIKKDQPMELSLSSREDHISITGPVANIAENRPIQREDILKQMNKTGNVPFTLEHMEIDLDDSLFVQASILKDMRQRAYGLLEEQHKKNHYRDRNVILTSEEDDSTICEEILKETHDVTSVDSSLATSHELLASVYEDSIYRNCLEDDFFDGIVLSMDFYNLDQLISMKSEIHLAGKKAYLSLPRVYRQSKVELLSKLILQTMTESFDDIDAEAKYSIKEKWDGIYINNINELSVLKNSWMDIPVIYGASLYQWNSNSVQELLRLDQGKHPFYRELSYESSRKECMDINRDDAMECLIYGRFPVMLSAQCLKKTCQRCNHKPEICTLDDRNHHKLPVSSHCNPYWIDTDLCQSKKTAQGCYNMIWMHTPRNLIGEEFQELAKNTARLRFDYFGSTMAEVSDSKKDYMTWSAAGFALLSANQMRNLKTKNHTEEGHWNYGIE